jgi:alpha-tubulin suppressor-like RCC1 family protein
MKIILLTPEQALSNWATLSGLFADVLEHSQGESTLTDYMKKILNGVAHCWAVLDNDGDIVGAGLTQYLQYAQHKTLHIIAFSGSNFEEQSQVFPTVEQFARDSKCKAIEQWGRPGWAKVLPKYVPGFKEAYVVMRKDLYEV